MNTRYRSVARLGVAALFAATALPLVAATASANPSSDQPCDVSDLVVSVTQDPHSSAGQQAFVLHYLDDPNGTPAPVNVQPGKDAESRILMSSQAPVSFQPDVVNLDLPVEGGHTTTVSWPSGQPLRGSSVELTSASPA